MLICIADTLATKSSKSRSKDRNRKFSNKYRLPWSQVRLYKGGERGYPSKRTVIKAWKPDKDRLHTITADNGKEFAKRKDIADGLDINVYFARSCHFLKRGAKLSHNYKLIIHHKFSQKIFNSFLVIWIVE